MTEKLTPDQANQSIGETVADALYGPDDSDPMKAKKQAAIDKLFAPPPPLSQLPAPEEITLAPECQARVLALNEARQALAARNPLGTGSVDHIKLVQVAQYILTGKLAITADDVPEITPVTPVKIYDERQRLIYEACHRAADRAYGTFQDWHPKTGDTLSVTINLDYSGDPEPRWSITPVKLADTEGGYVPEVDWAKIRKQGF